MGPVTEVLGKTVGPVTEVKGKNADFFAWICARRLSLVDGCAAGGPRRFFDDTGERRLSLTDGCAVGPRRFFDDLEARRLAFFDGGKGPGWILKLVDGLFLWAGAEAGGPIAFLVDLSPV